MIKMTNIRKVYNGDDFETVAIEGLSLTINKGEFVSIMGESGSGKTTLLNIMGFLDTATQGKYFFDGEDVSEISNQNLWRYRRKYTGFVFQNFALIDNLTVKDNVMIPLEALGFSYKKRKDRVRNILENLNILDLEKKYPPQISGGQRQRVAIARAVVAKPDIILADEPTGALDQKTGSQIMELFTELNKKGHTIVVVTHDARVAEYTNRTIMLT